MYEYKGTLDEEDRPKLIKLSDDQIDKIISDGLKVLDINDPVTQLQKQELSINIRRDLRSITVQDQFELNEFSQFIADRLFDSTTLVGERVGSKAACMVIADITQKIISEKRGGSTLEVARVPLVDQYGELIKGTKDRIYRVIWAYPQTSKLHYPPVVNDSDIEYIKRNIVSVSLKTVIDSHYVVNYNDNDNPDWYQIMGYGVVKGFAFRIDLNKIKCFNYAVTVHDVADAILQSLATTGKPFRLYVSPASVSSIDVSPYENNERVTVAKYGSELIIKQESIIIKGTPGIKWVQTDKVSPFPAIVESIPMANGKWATYYSPTVLMRYNMKNSHLFRWLNTGGIVHVPDPENNCFYTDNSPYDDLKIWNDNVRSKEVRFAIEYNGKDIASLFHNKLFDIERMHTNDFYAMMDNVGLGALRHYWATEFHDLVLTAVPGFDGRHSELIADTMLATGTITSISAKGAYLRGSDIFTLLSTKSPDERALLAASLGLEASVNTAAGSHFSGAHPIPNIGSKLWSTTTPLTGSVGLSATQEQIESLKGNRIPASIVQKPKTTIITPRSPRVVASGPIFVSGKTRLNRIPKK